jgi:hypothetical protein
MTLGNMREVDFSRFADLQFFVVPMPDDLIRSDSLEGSADPFNKLKT